MVKLQELRHFAATAMLDVGESYRTVAKILGNSENTLRLHYDGRTDVGKRKAIQALEFDKWFTPWRVAAHKYRRLVQSVCLRM